jgi:hypothetical protein
LTIGQRVFLSRRRLKGGGFMPNARLVLLILALATVALFLAEGPVGPF